MMIDGLCFLIIVGNDDGLLCSHSWLWLLTVAVLHCEQDYQVCLAKPESHSNALQHNNHSLFIFLEIQIVLRICCKICDISWNTEMFSIKAVKVNALIEK